MQRLATALACLYPGARLSGRLVGADGRDVAHRALARRAAPPADDAHQQPGVRGGGRPGGAVRHRGTRSGGRPHHCRARPDHRRHGGSNGGVGSRTPRLAPRPGAQTRQSLAGARGVPAARLVARDRYAPRLAASYPPPHRRRPAGPARGGPPGKREHERVDHARDLSGHADTGLVGDRPAGRAVRRRRAGPAGAAAAAATLPRRVWP